VNQEASGAPADLAALAANPSTPAPELASALMRCADPSAATPQALPIALALAAHPDPEIRRAAAQVLPALGQLDRDNQAYRDAVVHSLITLTADEDDHVRDWACFALGTQLSDIDNVEIRAALMRRLRDSHDDTRCEAMLGLARRGDGRILPLLRERLAAPNVYVLEIEAAGAIGDPSLHAAIRSHLAGWEDDVVPKVCAALRLTDPEGVGDDLLDGLANWFRAAAASHASPQAPTLRRAPQSPAVAGATATAHARSKPTDDDYWWGIAEGLLDLSAWRSVELAESVRLRLRDTPRALARMLDSPLADIARAHGWIR
jgi:hypothetical protein